MASGGEYEDQSSEPKSDSRMIAGMPQSDSYCKTTKRIVNISHIWTIKNFSFSVCNEVVKSPSFGSDYDPGTRWALNLCPSGDEGARKDHISLYLRLESSESEVINAKYTFTLLDASRRVLGEFTQLDVTRFHRNEGWGSERFASGDWLHEDTMLPDDMLIVHCEVSYDLRTENIPTQRSPVQPRGDVTEDFSEPYKSKALFDVVFHLDGKKFRAHRFILAARSSILKAMFEPDRKKGRKSKIIVLDLTEQTLENLLRFIYTGEADDLDGMQNLLDTIDHYVYRKKKFVCVEMTEYGEITIED